MKLSHALLGAAVVLAFAIGIVAVIGNEDTDDPAVAGVPTDFVGQSLDEASARADDEGRPWRIGREDGEDFALTDDLVPGRVTFEVNDGIVTSADIEEPNTGSEDDSVEPNAARAELIAAAVQRLLTVDNSFGGVDVFDDIRVARTLGGDSGQRLKAIDRDFISAAVSEIGTLRFIDDMNAEIAKLFDQPPAGVALVGIERVELFDDRAEVEMRLWCGSLCGVFLTYEAVPDGSGWTITGTTGPIAVS